MNSLESKTCLQLVSSGGGAHIAAGKFLEEKHKKEGYKVETINVMRSKCTFHARIGKAVTDLWDKAQAAGDVKKQITLVGLQWVTEKLFYLPTYLFILGKLNSGKDIEKIELTSPMFLRAICDAVLAHNKRHGKDLKVELHMVEPPTDEATYYLHALKSLNKKQKDQIVLFASRTKEEKYWENILGLSENQVIFEPPVDPFFKKTEISPNQSVELKLKISGKEEVFDIQKEDRVGLIMLGSVPTKSAILNYVDEALALAKKKSCSERKNYLFVACGREDLHLFEEVVKKLENQNSSLKIVPFIGQPVKEIFARADFSITRSGALTSQEILAMKEKQEGKSVYIHSQLPSDTKDKNEIAHRALAFKGEGTLTSAYREYLVSQGIPLWEGANANFIIDSFPEKADVVRPKDVGPVLDRHFFDANQEEMKTDEAAICQYKGEITKAKKVARQKKIAKLAGLAALVIFAFAGLAIIIANSYVTLPFVAVSIVAVISSMNIAATVITSLFLSALSLSAAKKLHELRKKRVWDWKLVKL